MAETFRLNLESPPEEMPRTKAAAEVQSGVFLFAYFCGNGEDGLHLASSRDGYHWTVWNHRIYATTTRDFKSFTPTRLFFDGGFNVIDATILKAGKQFHLIVKDETKTPVKKNLRIARSTQTA